MKKTENIISLTDVSPEWCVAYAMSTDLNFGARLPKHMNEVYDLESQLRGNYYSIGDIAVTGKVISLFVKESTYHDVEIDNLAKALLSLKVYVIRNSIEKLAIPRLCCGKNGLTWDKVEPLIDAMFADMNIEILICGR